MERPGHESFEIQELYGEPVVRQDGEVMALYVTKGYLTICFDGMMCGYSFLELERIGEGSVDAGISKVARAYYEAPSERLGGGLDKLLLDQTRL